MAEPGRLSGGITVRDHLGVIDPNYPAKPAAVRARA